MKFLEKNLEQIIFEADKKQLSARGLTICGRLYRQLRIGNYGIADIVEFERYGSCLTVTVYELKNDVISIGALDQAVGYLHGIEEYLNRRNIMYDNNAIVLIGRDYDKSGNLAYFGDIFDRLSIYTYDYTLTGIEFTEISGYHLVDDGFRDKLINKNFKF